MPYDLLRSTVHDVLDLFPKGDASVEEHPYGSMDMMTLSVLRKGVVRRAFILVASDDNRSVDVDEIDLTTFLRTTVRTFTMLQPTGEPNPKAVTGLATYFWGVIGTIPVKRARKAPPKAGPPRSLLDHLLDEGF